MIHIATDAPFDAATASPAAASSPLLDSLFHPLIVEWFTGRFGEPTEPQRLGWPQIAAGRNTLIAAPTGSGKTLSAFLSCIDRLFRESVTGDLEDQTQVVYVSPLKALSNDVRRNLQVPLEEIHALAHAAGLAPRPVRALVRTGDTPAAQRQAMIRKPPHILVTTPESLYLLLTSSKGRESLRTVRTVIVDEIHALARDKRGSHLTLTLERLAALCESPPVRIGLSATQRPIDDIARFLVGNRNIRPDGEAGCAVLDVGHLRQLDLGIEVPPSELAAVCSNEQWAEAYQRLTELIQTHRSTLVFVNTRRLAERVAHQLTELLGEDAVASHHGSLSREIRQSAEERLKNGQLKVIVATASLEMGIDVGFIDLVCQIGSPRSIATLLQRIGRSGHSLGVIPKGRLFPLNRDELLECLALVRAIRGGRLDQVEIPRQPLDILAQQIVATVACDEWEEEGLYQLCRRAWPYRDLSRASFDAIVSILSEGLTPTTRQGAYLHRDAVNGRLRARRGARIAAITGGGAIPEMADYRVVTEEERTYVGTVNEDFAIESMTGDVFLLGNSSWRVRYVRSGEVVVSDAHGAPASVPFWLGEAPGRTIELSGELSQLREELERRVQVTRERGGEGARESEEYRHASEPSPAFSPSLPHPVSPTVDDSESAPPERLDSAIAWLRHECLADDWAAEQAARYVAAQKAAIGLVPSIRRIVFERFFDESGGMQLVIHAPLGGRINRAWGLALRKRFCRSFDFELQAAADDDGIVLSLGPQHSFPLDALFKMLSPQNGEYLLTQALLAAPVFKTRWRWNVTRALAVMRSRNGKKVPPQLQRMRADDLLASVFPQTVGCLENHHGDIEIPDHPLVAQTVYDCLHEAMDIDRWLDMLGRCSRGEIELIPRDTREPSPFSHKLLNSNPYTFLDDAPLEERRARAVAVRRTLSIESARDLGQLDADAIAQVRSEAWPLVRDADELHDALLTMGALPAAEGVPWQKFFAQLLTARRATTLRSTESPTLWVAAERLSMAMAAFPQATVEPPLDLPAALIKEWQPSDARVAILRGRLQCSGPTTAAAIASDLGMDVSAVEAALVALEGEGNAMRGRFTPSNADTVVEWCERRLLARIHRQTLDGLRRKIQPVSTTDYLRFLVRHQRVLPDLRWRGQAGVGEALRQLQGYEAAAGAWEQALLPARVRQYDPASLDQLSMTGELVWGRLRPPRKDDEDGPSAAGITRAAPISLVLRDSLGWLLPDDRPDVGSFARSNAKAVLEALSQLGALFQHELAGVTQLLPAHLAEALHELAALGLVTADAFGAVRAFVAPPRRGRPDRLRTHSRTSAHNGRSPGVATGRWSLFPGLVSRPTDEERLANWARQLLDRWGVVFRDLLAQEPVAPSWGQLVFTLRRMEARGEIRGGRFVADVGGEQFASSKAVEALRQIRDEPPANQWVVISAADPLNLSGILTLGPRIPCTHKNTLVLCDGRYVATQQAGEIAFHAPLASDVAVEMSRKLRRTG